MKKSMLYDIIIQNNGDKRMWVLRGLENVSDTHLYLDFEDVELPEGAEDGEYTYACIQNSLQEAQYDLKTAILDTIVTVDGSEFKLKDLKPITGIIRVGEVTDKNIYQDKKNKNYYYKK